MILSTLQLHDHQCRSALVAAIVGLAACGGGGAYGGAAEAPTPTAAAERFTYGPFNRQYEAITYTRIDQGQMGVQNLAMRFYLTATAAQTGGASRLTLTIDSIPQAEGAMINSTEVAGASGVTFTGILSPDGEIMNFQGGDPNNALLTQISEGLAQFFPTIPEGGLAPGEVWHDTTTTLTGGQGVEIEIVATTRYEAGEWGEHFGARALPVRTRSDYTVTGGGNQGGADFTIDGSGVERGQVFLGSDGSYLGTISADSADMTAMVPAAGMSIPIVQTQVDTVRVVR